MTPMQRLELIIEKMAYKRACRVLEQAGITGYTVVPALAGFGGGNHWQRDTDISGANDMVVIVTIGDSVKIEAALKQMQSLFESHIGILNVSDVRVMRPDRF